MRHPNGRLLRTVWVLGAGFSKSLGGPLLGELFRKQEKRDLAQLFAPPAYPNDRLPNEIFVATRLFQQGKAEKQWDDPEQFLDSLEAVVRLGSPADGLQIASLFSRATTGNHELYDWQGANTLLVAARRALAADCTMFLRTADPRAERWSPYCGWVDWMHQMVIEAPASEARQTVVTFNYDRVLELIDPDGERLKVVLPGEALGADRVNVLKVHGSVDWKAIRTDDLKETRFEGDTERVHNVPVVRVTFERGRSEEALLCASNEIGMATPGPGKREAGTEPLWAQAEEAIRSAEVVVFLGYRFPPGDADARRRILGAILQNKEPHLELISVLGPNLKSEEALRLRHLLDESAHKNRGYGWWHHDGPPSTFHVDQVPLYAKDYLSLFGELNLFQFGDTEPSPRG